MREFSVRDRCSSHTDMTPSSNSPGVQPKIEAIRALYAGKKIIIGRDKLDVVKGVLQKLQAFEKLLIEFPEWHNNVGTHIRHEETCR